MSAGTSVDPGIATPAGRFAPRCAGVVLLDVGGTLSPLRCGRDVLLPYARSRIGPRVLAGGVGIATVLAGVRAALGDPDAPERQVVATLLNWHDAGVSVPVLSALHGLIWAEGCARGEIDGEVYPDVAPALRRWTDDGLDCWVFSPGTAAAQRGWFARTADGDLRGLLRGFFDPVTAAPAHQPRAYERIADAIGLPPSWITFCSDDRAELDAARAAGCGTVGISRVDEGSPEVGDHRRVTGFDALRGRADLCAGDRAGATERRSA